jgi:hypothetical protein
MSGLVGISLSSLRQGRWYEYLVRFLLGGAATVLAGAISSVVGASFGGLFLALPAIFCASATLVEKHEIRRKREVGLKGQRRGQQAAALDAAGASAGAVGLISFAIVFGWMIQRTISGAFVCASIAWAVMSFLAWFTRRWF